jgi:hypothetical protein
VEGHQQPRHLLWRIWMQISDHGHGGLLRLRCKRPRGRCPAEQRDEIAPF